MFQLSEYINFSMRIIQLIKHAHEFHISPALLNFWCPLRNTIYHYALSNAWFWSSVSAKQITISSVFQRLTINSLLQAYKSLYSTVAVLKFRRFSSRIYEFFESNYHNRSIWNIIFPVYFLTRCSYYCH